MILPPNAPRIRYYQECAVTVINFAVMLCTLHHGRKSIHYGVSTPCVDCASQALWTFAF